MTSPYRSLPSVDRVLSDERVQLLLEEYSREAIIELVQSQLSGARKAISDGAPAPDFDTLVHTVEESASSKWRHWPEHVINATGVILHTNLGRAPLSREATDAVIRAASGYSDLELDLESGTRGSRQAYISSLLTQVTGAEAAMAVNNNASAVLLVLAAIASGKEVIVSRGEAVEIGGGFRVPDVLRQSGATLVEVGTTNRTYARDFEAAITENTGAILSIHASNFRVIGFTHAPEISELVALGEKYGIPVLHDIGSGCLLDTAQFGLAHEPMPQESVRAGVGLGMFSGDKLLGGPQAGLIAGKRDLIEVVSRHPLARAVRIDKLSMASLSETLLHYIKGEATQKIPIWRMMAASESELKIRASSWTSHLGERVDVIQSSSTIGGGSLPGETLPSWVLSIDTSGIEGGADALSRRFRRSEPPVVGRIEEERVLLDPRTVLPEEEQSLMLVLKNVLG